MVKQGGEIAGDSVKMRSKPDLRRQCQLRN